LGRQLLWGMRYPFVRRWGPETANTLAEMANLIFSNVFMKILYFVWIVGFALLPNFFRPNHEGHFHPPLSMSGWFCYSVFLLSMILPNSGLRLILFCVSMVREDLWRVYRTTTSLNTMLLGERAAGLRLLPNVRYYSHGDLLAWIELSELLSRSKSHYRLPVETGTGVVILVVLISVANMIFYMFVCSKKDLKLHAMLMSFFLWGIPFLALELTRAMWAGVCVNKARDANLKALQRLVLGQQLLRGHLAEIVAGHELDEIEGHQGLNPINACELTHRYLQGQRLAASDNVFRLLGLPLEVTTLIPLGTTVWSVLGIAAQKAHHGLQWALEDVFCEFMRNGTCT